MRTQPYKDVTRAKCARCGDRAVYQWEGPCAMVTKQGRTQYVPLCADCDRKLNRATLVFVYGKFVADTFMRGYE
jgi:NAD-dependent SIR2 family protein deacetylase